MRYTGIQPQYFPRLHYFARILAADVFLIRNDCQYVRNHKYPNGKRGSSYQAETPIRFPSGEYFMKLPICHEGKIPIIDTHLNYTEKWVQSHIGTLRTGYGKSLNFKELWPELKIIVGRRYDNLAELNNATIYWGILHLLEDVDVELEKLTLDYVNSKLAKNKIFRLKKLIIASDSKTFPKLSKMDANQKILAFIKEIGADEDYCGGTAHTAYMDEGLFKKNGIKVTVQDWKCQKYPQLFGKQQDFIANLSIIDLLMNVTLDQAVKIIKG